MVFGSVVIILLSKTTTKGRDTALFFIMRFLEGTDILVAEMPSSVFADMQQASDIAIERKIIHNDPVEASLRQEYAMEVPQSFHHWITLLIDHAYEFHKLKYGIATEGAQNLHITNMWCNICLLYTSPSPRDLSTSRMPSSA